MGGLLPAPVVPNPATAPPSATAKETSPGSNTASPLPSKPPRPSLPSLKKTPSFSVKEAMAGKVASAVNDNQSSQYTANTAAGNGHDTTDEEEDTLETSFEEVELTSKNLEIAWSRFAEHIKSSRPRIFHTLQSAKPNLIDDTLITFDVVNTLQKEDLMTIYNELVSYLRRSLSTPLLELEFNVAEFESHNARPYTVEEKFKHMIVKNPALLTLKQALGLDFE